MSVRTRVAGIRCLIPAASCEAKQGWSLIEMLVVLAILALVAAVALPGAQMPGQGPSLRLVAADMTTKLRAARNLAVTEQREVAFAFDSETRTYGVDGLGAPRALPAAVEVSMTTARQYVRDAGEARLVFYSDGSSSGGTIRLAGQHQRIVIGVAWLTGAVHADRDVP